MRRAAALLLLAGLAAGGPAAAQERVAAAAVRFVDGVPQGPSAHERLAEIRRRIQAALVYPELARRERLAGEALVRFEIARDGAPRAIEVQRSSGMPTLDRAAARAVADAAPLPWVYGRLEVPVRFALEGR
jgi:TonB family protein